ncbi:MAG: hypothetical protein ACJAWM_002015 [Sulfitobacter sp.]
MTAGQAAIAAPATNVIAALDNSTFFIRLSLLVVICVSFVGPLGFVPLCIGNAFLAFCQFYYLNVKTVRHGPSATHPVSGRRSKIFSKIERNARELRINGVKQSSFRGRNARQNIWPWHSTAILNFSNDALVGTFFRSAHNVFDMKQPQQMAKRAVFPSNLSTVSTHVAVPSTPKPKPTGLVQFDRA